MSRRWICALLAGAAWLPSSAALAQRELPTVQMKPPPAEGTPTVAPIAVESTTPAGLKAQTYEFVQAFSGATPRLDQIGRWTGAMCVTVQGLPADQAASVKGRIEEVATALRVQVAKRGCNPNIEVFFADQPQPFLDRVASTREDLLGYWHQRDRDALKTMTRPIQAWYVTATASTAGSGAGTVFADTDSTQPNKDGSHQQLDGEIIDDPDNAAPRGCGQSRLSSCLKSVFSHVLIAVDNRAVQGTSSALVGDYVAMLAMAQPLSLDACTSLKSVIDLYSRGCAGREPPDGLTRADVAYLTSLYAINLEAKKDSQRADIASRMADMLLKANATDRLTARGGATAASTRR